MSAVREACVQIEAIRTPSLGDTTYVLTHEESAIVVDPQRDIHRFLGAASGLAITHVLETHVHNDYVSGGRDLARQAGGGPGSPCRLGSRIRLHTRFSQGGSRG